MSRLGQTFESLHGRGRTALIPYLTAGDPDPDLTVSLLHTLVGAGADVVELGIPFSDPMADGPVIQRASDRALAAGTTLASVLAMVARFRRDDAVTPIVLMGYLNPIEAMGHEAFAHAAAAAGVDGIIVVDAPPEEARGLNEALRAEGLDPVLLLAPTTVEERIRLICETASGFIYYVSLRGVTGAANLDLAEVGRRIREIKSHTELPVGVGFGIRDAQTARAVSEFADAVIVGSAVVQLIESHLDDAQSLKDELARFVSTLRAAMDAGGSPTAVAS